VNPGKKIKETKAMRQIKRFMVISPFQIKPIGIERPSSKAEENRRERSVETGRDTQEHLLKLSG
jgi:hypothetical protein